MTETFSQPDDVGDLKSSELKSSLGERLGAQAGEAFMGGVRGLGRQFQYASAEGIAAMTSDAASMNPETQEWLEKQRAAIPEVPMAEAHAHVKQEGLEGQFKLPDQKTIKKPVLDLMVQHAHERQQYNAAVSRGPQNLAVDALGFVTEVGAGIIDPVNVAAFSIPVIGEARFGLMMKSAGESIVKRAGVRAGVGTAQGAVGGAALVPGDWWLHTKDGVDYTMADALHSVVMSAGMGGAFHAAGGLYGDVRTRLAGQPLHPAEVLADLPPRAQEDVVRASMADVINGNAVRAGEMLNEAAKEDPRIAESLRGEPSLLPSPTRGDGTQGGHEAVFSEVHGALTKAGMEDTEARTHASVVAARYSTRAARLGGSALEQYSREGLEVRSGETTPTDGRSFDQLSIPRVSDIINGFKSVFTGRSRAAVLADLKEKMGYGKQRLPNIDSSGPEVVAGAAIRFRGETYRNVSHPLAVLDVMEAHPKLSLDEIGKEIKGDDEGFVTSKGRYLTRNEANKSAGVFGSGEAVDAFGKPRAVRSFNQFGRSPDHSVADALVAATELRKDHYPDLPRKDQDILGEFTQAVRSAAAKRQLSIEDGVVHQGDRFNRKPLKGEKIVAAAVRFDDKVYQGDVHFNALEAAAKDHNMDFSEFIDFVNGKVGRKEATADLKGFLTSQGRYVSREEANTIADRAEQLNALAKDNKGKLSMEQIKAEDRPYLGRPSLEAKRVGSSTEDNITNHAWLEADEALQRAAAAIPRLNELKARHPDMTEPIDRAVKAVTDAMEQRGMRSFNQDDAGITAIRGAIDRLGERGSEWVDVPEGRIYLRAGERPGIGRTLEIPNIEFDEGARGKGAFTRYLTEIEKMASERNFEGVYVEQLFNKRLEQFLRKRGYRNEPRDARLAGLNLGEDQATLYKPIHPSMEFMVDEPFRLSNGRADLSPIETDAADVLASAKNRHGAAMRDVREMIQIQSETARPRNKETAEVRQNKEGEWEIWKKENNTLWIKGHDSKESADFQANMINDNNARNSDQASEAAQGVKKWEDVLSVLQKWARDKVTLTGRMVTEEERLGSRGFSQRRSDVISAAKGRITLGSNKAIIDLFAGADRSTFMHEMGHLWLDELVRDAEQKGVPQALKDDLGTVLRWLGVSKADEIGTPQHEQWARGFEQYLMEGRAPSNALSRAFEQFKQWLTSIYKSLSNLGTPITDDIRGVMDRMLATDKEIAERGRADWQKLADAKRGPDDDLAGASVAAEKAPEPESIDTTKSLTAAEKAAQETDQLLKDILPTLSESERKSFEGALALMDQEKADNEKIVKEGFNCLMGALA